MHQIPWRLMVRHLFEANQMIRDLKKLIPQVTFPFVSCPKDLVLCVFSDASHPRKRGYGHWGLITRILSCNGLKRTDIIHVIDWSPHIQHQISHSFYRADILGAPNGDDSGYYTKIAIDALFPATPLKVYLNLEPRAMCDMITSLHEEKVYRLRQTDQPIRNFFKGKKTNIICWIPGRDNLANALTKRNTMMCLRLNRTCASSVSDKKLTESKVVEPDLW